MYTIITNPASQSGNDHQKFLKKLENALQARHISYQVKYSEKAGDPERIASDVTEKPSSPDDTIIVIGGDGTINGAINGIRDFSRVKFGFIPAGSANDLAKGLTIPDINRDPGQEENIQRIAEGNVRRTIDLGEIRPENAGSRLFAVSAGIGFDAAVCHESDASGARGFFNALRLGALTYGTIALKQLITAPETPCDITMNTGTEFHIRKLVFATFMNTPYEGGGYKFAPDAVPDDGKINVSAVGDLSKLTVLLNFPSAHKGTYYRVKGVYHAGAPGIRVHTEMPLWVHTDGEVLGKFNDLSVECLPGQLRLVV